MKQVNDQAFELIKEVLSDIKSDINEIKQDNNEIKKTMVVNTNSLSEHMRRTDALEKHVSILEGKVDDVKVFAHRYDVFIKVLKVIPVVIFVTFIFTIFIWVSIGEDSKQFIIKFITNNF